MAPSVLTIILAGGRGARLEPLTRDRAKPAVPFGGAYRVIDFALSNCFNSGLRQILVLTQYKAYSLDRHLAATWGFLNRDFGEFVDIIPPQQRISENWYLGTADAIYQNIYAIEQAGPELCLVLGGDHIYKMNYRAMIDYHLEKDADLTIACLPVERGEARRFGVMGIDDGGRVESFVEKPTDPPPMPGHPSMALASMGIYVFRARALYELLCADAVRSESNRDFGKDVIPAMIEGHKVFGYLFRDENRKAAAYWRDIGTIDEYFAANMDLIEVEPVLNLYDERWPIRTWRKQDPPPKFVFAEAGAPGAVRRGEAIDSIVCPGTIVSGGSVRRSILSRKVRVNSYATVDDSLLFDDVEVGRHCRIRRSIIDKGVKVPPGMSIGVDPELDRRRGFLCSEGGVVIIPKGENLDVAYARAPEPEA